MSTWSLSLICNIRSCDTAALTGDAVEVKYPTEERGGERVEKMRMEGRPGTRWNPLTRVSSSPAIPPETFAGKQFFAFAWDP
jgi:hypothetical protein